MSTLNNVVLFVVVLFGSVGCGSSTPTRTTTTSAPTRPPVEVTESWVRADGWHYWDEANVNPRGVGIGRDSVPAMLQDKRRAYARLTRAMEAAQSETGTERIRNLDHAIRHAYRVFYTLFEQAEVAAMFFRQNVGAVMTVPATSATQRAVESFLGVGDLGDHLRNRDSRERQQSTIRRRQSGADDAVEFAELLEQPTEAQRRLASLFRIGDNAVNPSYAVHRAYERMIEAHAKDWSVYFRTLQEGIDALLQGAELLATMPGADGVFAAPRLRSAIQTAKQQSVRMGEFVIEPPTVPWRVNRLDGRSDANSDYDEALRELTRAALHVASNLLETSRHEPPPLE